MDTKSVAAAVTVSQPLVEFVHGVGPYGARALITERAGSVAVEPMKLAEKATRGKGFIQELADGRFRVRAKAQHVGVVNRNKRRYRAPVWERHLVAGAQFQVKIGGRGTIGHIEHPGDGKSQMPLGAIVVTEASPPDEDGEIWITFETMSTPPGKLVEAYIRDRVRFGLSSRGNGSVRSIDGVDEVQEDFEPITWDCVIDESTPGAEVPAIREDVGGTAADLRRFVVEARKALDTYVTDLNERAGGDAVKARALAEADARQNAESIIDCTGGVCVCPITESEMPPSGYSRYLLAFEDGSAHYRAYQGTTGQWEVWMHPHNLMPERLASKIPTLDSCQMVAENHYKLVLAGGAMSAQQHAERSNAIGTEAASLAPATVMAPNIGGLAGMMGRYSAPVGPGPVTGGRPSKIVLSFESVRPQWRMVLAKLQETWKDALTLPYSGTVMRIHQADAKVLPALKRAGIVASSIAEGAVQVYSPFESGAQAAEHIGRILEKSGIKANIATVGAIRDGRVVEGDMEKPNIATAATVAEAGNVGKQPGEMAGGHTADKKVSMTIPRTISPEYKGEDPEDLDHNLDINEDEDPGEPKMMGEDDEPINYDGDMDDGGPDDDDDYFGMGDEVGEDAEMMPSSAPLKMPESAKGDDEEDDKKKDDKKESVTPAAPADIVKMVEKAVSAARRDAVPAPKHYDAFRESYAKRYNTTTAPKGARKVKEDRMYSVAFTRMLREQAIGAVRVWFGKNDRPTGYEFYNTKGILEVVTNHKLRVTHRALQEGQKPSPIKKGEVWVAEDRKTFEPRKIFEMGLGEGDLPGRHGADTGVVVKSDEYKGKEGPEYSTIAGMEDPGDHGEEGDGLTAGDYDKASEEGDGEYVEKGTWPTSGAPISIAPSHTAEGRITQRSDVAEGKKGKGKGKGEDFPPKKDDEKDKKKDEAIAAADKHLREKVAYLESELAKYESMCQEQHETIEALRESARQAEMERARAEAFEKHPELRRMESRLMRCESIEDLSSEVAGLVSLVESKKAPATAPLVERTAGGNGTAASAATSDGVPADVLNESSSFSDRLGAGARSPITTTDVASRVAAHRKRRRGS